MALCLRVSVHSLVASFLHFAERQIARSMTVRKVQTAKWLAGIRENEPEGHIYQEHGSCGSADCMLVKKDVVDLWKLLIQI